MKIVITCDQLVEKDRCHEIVELLCGLYEDAEIYTLAHQKGKVLGHIELRKIHSSFLSHKVNSKKDLGKYSFLIPSAAKGLFIPCSVDLIINITTGFSHGIKKCENTKLISYVYSLEDKPEKQPLFSRMFNGYLAKWSTKNLEDSDLILASSPSISKKLTALYPHKKIKVLTPFFQVDDYPLIPSSYWKHDFILVSTEGINNSVAKKVYDLLMKMNIRFQFLGNDRRLSEFKNSLTKEERGRRFLGYKCAGDAAPLLASCLTVVDLSENKFPFLALEGLSTGRPCIVRDTTDNRFYLKGKGVNFLSPYWERELTNCVRLVFETKSEIDSKKLRSMVVGFHPMKFKGEIHRSVASYLN